MSIKMNAFNLNFKLNILTYFIPTFVYIPYGSSAKAKVRLKKS